MFMFKHLLRAENLSDVQIRNIYGRGCHGRRFTKAKTSKRTVDALEGVKLDMSGDGVCKSNKEAGIQSSKRQDV